MTAENDGMAQLHEWMFYEFIWRAHTRQAPIPLPWWVQQYMRHWVDAYDHGLFSSKEAAFVSNAHYRYWSMVGVKDHRQESLVGQAGEVEPVYDQYAVGFFLFEPSTRRLHFPQHLTDGAALHQELEDGYLPVVHTTYRSPSGIEIRQKVVATTVGANQRSVVLIHIKARPTGAQAVPAWLCVSLSPEGPTGFQRHDRAGRYQADRRLTFLKYVEAQRRVECNAGWGPVFGTAPSSFGLYGNSDVLSPDHYLAINPFADLSARGALNNVTEATDHIAGMCSGVFAWPLNFPPANGEFSLDIRLPVDDFRGQDDLAELRADTAAALEQNNKTFWSRKLDQSGLQASLPQSVRHLFTLYRICRGNLLILSDHGQIHPGPTIYDSFWVRDSSVEGMACALAGDENLAERQFGHHYGAVFNFGDGGVGPVSLRGFFGGEHEKNDHEWDSNGQALWAIGRFDRVRGPGESFGRRLFTPYVIEGARWLRDNRSEYGLLHSGWSAEHIGDKHNPHYWDDFWGIAGLWESARLAHRLGAPEASEIQSAYDALVHSTSASIRWVLAEQRRRGAWETFIPTGPADVGRLDSTIVGAAAYFHPCRLYMGMKLGADIDWAARMTIETIWHNFITGGFRHNSAWYCYGPYLTLQLAHTFLLIGDVQRMDSLLAWSVNAAFSEVTRPGMSSRWKASLGAWNEQHCYPVASDFGSVPGRHWYMGDIPHGWACAEFMLLLRDILFFEADEDHDPHIYLAPGVMPHWVGDGQEVGVTDAPTVFGQPFGYRLTHRQASKTIGIEILQPPPSSVRFVYPCRFGPVRSARTDGRAITVSGNDIHLPAGMTQATIVYG